VIVSVAIAPAGYELEPITISLFIVELASEPITIDPVVAVRPCVLAPIKILLLPVLTVPPALLPTIVLLLPVDKLLPAAAPIAAFEFPVVSVDAADAPNAVFDVPVDDCNAVYPTAV
jgi:hypothetical protein